MSYQNRKKEEFNDRIQRLKDYVLRYQYSLRASKQVLPEDASLINPDMVALGRADIWACQDAGVVLFYHSEDQRIDVRIMPVITSGATDFFKNGEVHRFFGPNGQKHFFVLSMSDGWEKQAIKFLARAQRSDGSWDGSEYAKALVVGWDAELLPADEEAVKDIRSAFAQGRSKKETVEKLLEDYVRILNTAVREEEVQIFLKEHPDIIFPDFVKAYPKFQLGEKYVTDFVLSRVAMGSLEYHFVEIEKPSKDLFVKAGHFRAEFTQAKNQLLDWESYVTKNWDEFNQRLPNFSSPHYLLIMGRSDTITEEHKEKLRTEFGGGSRSFITFDDLADRFRLCIKTFFDKGPETAR